MARPSILAVVALLAGAVAVMVGQEARVAPTTKPNDRRVEHVQIVPPPPTLNVAPTIAFPRTAPSLSREHYEVTAKIELNDGTTLAGDIHSDGPLQCMTLFGQVGIPFNQIKGIEWQRKT